VRDSYIGVRGLESKESSHKLVERRKDMTLPGFTAQASLGTKKEAYALALGFRTGGAEVVPQLFCRSDEGGTTCTYCWDEGGFSGCYSFRLPRYTLF